MTWEQLPDSARLWVYVADRQLTPSEVEHVQTQLQAFVGQWTAHQRALSAYADVVFDRFVRIAVDQSQAGASGCSIDASVRYLQTLGDSLGVSFFERLTFFADNGKGFWPYPKDDFAIAYAAGEITDASPVIDPLVDSKAAFDRSFVRPLGESWHIRMV